jgi:hypothetical protein
MIAHRPPPSVFRIPISFVRRDTAALRGEPHEPEHGDRDRDARERPRNS